MNKTREPLILRFVDRFVKPFLDKDLNYQAVREILKLKLTLDKRRVPGSYKQKGKNGEPKEVNRSMLLTCLLYLFMGLFVAGLQMIPNHFVGNVFSYGALIFVLLSVYIGEYSAVLLDTTEKPFFGSLPVGKKEISTAKDIHIAYYIGFIAISAMLPSVVTAVFLYGLAYGSLYFLLGMVIVVFCLHLSGTLYFLLLQFFSGEKLKDILNGFQIFMTIALVISYQILPRLISFKTLAGMDFEANKALFFLPSAWFASFFAIFAEGKYNGYYFSLAAVGILAVVLLEWFYRKKIIKEFDKKLEKLTEEVKENKSIGRVWTILCKVLSRDGQERAFMELVLIQISRDRNLKMKLYPQLANAVILPLIFMLTEVQSGGFRMLLENIRTKPYYLALYAVGLSSTGIYTLIGQAENKESRLFYQILPIPNLSKCIRAGVKVVIFKYLSPLFILLAALFLGISGPKIIPDILIVYLAFLFVTGLLIRLNAWVLPFSTETTAGNVGYGFLMFLMSFILSGGLGILHFMFVKTMAMKGLAGFVLVAGNLILWKFFMNKKYVIERE